MIVPRCFYLTHKKFKTWWRHQHFPRYWPFVPGIHRPTVNSPHKGQWRGALMFSLIYAWINGSVNNRQAGDLRRPPAHYDVTVMNTMDVYVTSGLLWYIMAKNYIISLKWSDPCAYMVNKFVVLVFFDSYNIWYINIFSFSIFGRCRGISYGYTAIVRRTCADFNGCFFIACCCVETNIIAES